MAESQFSRPALPALINRQRTDLLSRLGQDDELRRADAEVSGSGQPHFFA